jgi:hypothetical protein
MVSSVINLSSGDSLELVFDSLLAIYDILVASCIINTSSGDSPELVFDISLANLRHSGGF